MLLAVNANSPFKELCNGWTKCVLVFGTVEIYRSSPLSLL